MKTPPTNILCQTSAHNWREVLYINPVYCAWQSEDPMVASAVC